MGAGRRQALEAAGWRCERCGRPGRLEVHHKQPLHLGGAPYALDNLVVLCRACHIETHRRQLSPAEVEWRRLVAELTRGLNIGPVGAQSSVVAGQAALRYSLMSPSQRVARMIRSCCCPRYSRCCLRCVPCWRLLSGAGADSCRVSATRGGGLASVF